MPCWFDLKKRVCFTAILAVLVFYQWSVWAAEPPAFLDNRLINPLDRASGTPADSVSLMPAIRNQGRYGTCWAFGAIGASEINWRLQLKAAREANPSLVYTLPDLSERYLAWNTYASPNKELDYKFPSYNVDWTSDIYSAGGWFVQATAIMARGTGLVTEQDYPYATNNMLPVEHTFKAAGLLTNAYNDGDNEIGYVDTPEKRLRLKELIQTTGAAAVNISSAGFNFSEYEAVSIYSPIKTFPDHAVVLVGWDDEYDFSLKTELHHKPSGKGAWIVRNSWGSGPGENGYYYLSYEDMTLTSGVGYGIETDANRYTRLDQNALLGYTRWLHVDSTDKGYAASYEAKASQFIKAVGFYVKEDSSSYEIQVRAGASSPEAGKTVYTHKGVFGEDGTPKWLGYRTVALSSFVFVPEGVDYTVTVKVTGPTGSVDIPVLYSSRDSHLNIDTSATTASPGQNFIYANGSWVDTTIQNATMSTAMRSLAKDSNLANGGDFTVSWLDDGGAGGSIINLGSANELYGTDPLQPERKTLSNMTADLTAGQTDSVYAGVIFGEGKVIKEGTGKLTLLGDNLYTGGTEINNGTLSITRRTDGSGGSIQGNVAVNKDTANNKIGRLQGNGTVYGAVTNSGIIAPGNSIGTLTVDSFIQNGNGLLEFEGGMNGGDKLRVLGNAVINGSIHFIPSGYFANGNITLNVNDFIEAQTLTLNPAAITGENANTATVSVQANNQNGNVTFTVSRATDAYSKTASTVEGYRLGSYLDQAAKTIDGDGRNLVGAIDFLGATVDTAGIQLQPRPYDSLLYSMQNNSRAVANSVVDHMLQLEPLSDKGWNVFAQPLRLTGRQNGWQAYDGFDSQSSGLLFGGDRHINNKRYSIYAGYLEDRTSVNSAASLQSKSKGGFLGVQGLHADNLDKGIFTYGIAQLGFDNYDVVRHVKMNGYSRNNESHWTGYSLLSEIGVGWKVPNKDVTWTPFAALNYSVNHWPRFNETCADGNASALERSSSNLHSLQSKLGIRAEFGKTTLNKQTERRYDVTALWSHEWKGNKTNYDWGVLGGQWHEDGLGGLGRDNCSITASAHFVDDNRFALRVSFGKQFGSGYHGSKAGVECNWYF